MSEASSIRAKPHSFRISAFLTPWFTAKSLSIAIVAQVNDRESCGRPSRRERAMNAENASEPQQTVSEPAAETSSELLTEVPIAGQQQQASPEQTAESRSRWPSGYPFRPPGRSRSRSRPVPKQASPARVPTLADVVHPDVSRRPLIPMDQLRQRPTLSGSWIDWDDLNRQTEKKRVALLRNILNDERMSDSFKMLVVGEKWENFESEDELMSRLQYAETEDLPPPGTPEEHERKEQVKMLTAEMMFMRTLLYHSVSNPRR